MEDKAQTNQVQTASMNRTKAPQKVEVAFLNLFLCQIQCVSKVLTSL